MSFLKHIPVILFAGSIAFSSCTKRDSIPTNNIIPATQTWKLDTTEYAVQVVARSNKLFYANGPVGLLAFSFASLPTSGGTYMVGDPQAAPNNVSIEASTGSYYIGQRGIVIVSVTGAKISLDAGNILMREVTSTDSVVLSAHLTEQ